MNRNIKKNNRHSKNKLVAHNKKQSQQFDRCRRCNYFPYYTVFNSPYTLDEHAVKHRDIKYYCLYDMHEITSKTKGCPRCLK